MPNNPINHDEKIQLTVQWLRDQVINANAKGIIVGISGGIDSAVVAHLIKRAFPDDSLGLIIPINSSQIDADDGIQVAESAELSYRIINGTEVHQDLYYQIMDILENGADITPDARRISEANLRARLRMCTLYTAANALNYLVAGTDNAAELYTGYFTKYGDGGVDILPIARLLKREVYQWAELLGVPESIIARSPSAGLWEGQTDESEMGISYAVIDAFLAGENVSEEEAEKLEKMHRQTMHKRTMPPLPDW